MGHHLILYSGKMELAQHSWLSSSVILYFDFQEMVCWRTTVHN